MKTRFVSILCLTLLSLAGCRHAAPSEAKKAAPLARDFYPLRVGNQWTYEIRASNQKMERTITIQSEQEGFFIDNTGAALRQDQTGLRDRNRYLLENPLEVGRKWISVQSVQAVEHFEITSVGQPCSTRAGSFPVCVTVRSTAEARPGKTLAIESTYAKDVGLVSLQSTMTEGSGLPQPQVELELTSYKPAP